MIEVAFASTTPGLEAALAHEAKALGRVTSVPGGVDLVGAPGLYRRANLHLRTASRVKRVLARFSAVDAAAVRAGLAKVGLFAAVPPGALVDLEVASEQSPFSAALLRSSAPRDWSLDRAGWPVALRARGRAISVELDSSGELLYRRGYRQETSRAPMRETLAAGLLHLADYDPSQPLWDPMCGSGTLAIEAAWMAQDRAPGLERPFAFERFADHDAAAWERERAEARALIGDALPAPIFASDLNAGALGVARRNARRAGVAQHLRFDRHDATAPRTALPGAGLVVANLPYGKRVGGDAALGELYRSFAAALKQGVPGWRVAWLVADARLLDVDIDWEAEHRVDNGGLRCVWAVGRL